MTANERQDQLVLIDGFIGGLFVALRALENRIAEYAEIKAEPTADQMEALAELKTSLIGIANTL